MIAPVDRDVGKPPDDLWTTTPSRWTRAELSPAPARHHGSLTPMPGDGG
jgi:hypothetical protein